MIGRTNASSGSAAPTTGDYLVRYIDIDGTVLKEQYVNSGQNATPPSNPNYDSSYLTFSAWSKSSTNIKNHKDIGALYTTLNNKTYAFITLTTASGVAPTLYFNKSDGSTLTVDWGDSTQSTFTNSGNFNTGAHNYSTTGNYIISIWISSGSGTYSFGNDSSTTQFLGTYKSTLTKIYVGSNITTLSSYSFYEHYSLSNISIPATVTTLNSNSMAYCYKLKCVIINDNVTALPTSLLSNVFSLINVVLPTTANISDNILAKCSGLKYIILPNTTSLSTRAFQYCYSIEKIVFNSISYINNIALDNCSSLKSLILPSGFLSFGSSSTYLSALELVDFPASVTNVGTFYFAYSLSKVICRATTPPTLAANAFQTSAANSTFKIYVPDASVATYKAATNWSTYTNYIYGISTM